MSPFHYPNGERHWLVILPLVWKTVTRDEGASSLTGVTTRDQGLSSLTLLERGALELW